MISRSSFRFSFVSYNILSQTLLTSHSHLYSDCNPHHLEWPSRGQRIITELLQNKADIICLQEVENEHLQNLFRPNLERYDYGCIYKKKTGLKIDGCAIFFKNTLFHLLSSRGIEFNRTDKVSLLNKDNVGLIAVFEPKTSTELKSNQLVIANTHLLFNPKRSDIKLAQLKLFLSELEKESLRYFDDKTGRRHYHPTIFCGDLNSVPDSDISRFMLKNSINRSRSNLELNSQTSHPAISTTMNKENNHFLTNEHLRELNHSFKFRSAHPFHNRNGEPYVSTFSKCMVDYIFYTSRLHLDSYKELLTKHELQEVGPIPNSEFPSDHLMLEASFIVD